jgi:hypothetical protein
LGENSIHFEPTVALCEAVVRTAPTLADQLQVECTDGTAAADCIPHCAEDKHGVLLLLNIEGEDSNMSCELRRGLYSWVGKAVRTAPFLPCPFLKQAFCPISEESTCCWQSDGGYLGSDLYTFFSSVVSGANGVYAVTLVEDPGVTTPLTITPGQDVTISGDYLTLPRAPQWGSGGFTVQDRGSLSLEYLELGTAKITMQSGGSLSLASMVVSDTAMGAAGLHLSGSGTTAALGRDSAATLRLSAITLTLTKNIAVSAGGIADLRDSTLSGTLAISDGSSLSLSGCDGQMSGLTVIDSTFAMDASSTTTLGGSISLANAGIVTLEDKTFAEGARLTATEGTQVNLNRCSSPNNELSAIGGILAVHQSTLSGVVAISDGTTATFIDTTFRNNVTVTVTGAIARVTGCMLEDATNFRTTLGGSLSLSSMLVPASVLSVAEVQLSGIGSMLRLSVVTIPEFSTTVSALTTVGENEFKTVDPPNPFGGNFTVSSGDSCTISAGGRCVERHDGFSGGAGCIINVGGGGLVLENCTQVGNGGVFGNAASMGYRMGRYDGPACPPTLLGPGALQWTPNCRDSRHNRKMQCGGFRVCFD